MGMRRTGAIGPNPGSRGGGAILLGWALLAALLLSAGPADAIDWGGYRWHWLAPDRAKYEVMGSETLQVTAPFGSDLGRLGRGTAIWLVREVPDNDFDMTVRVRADEDERVRGASYGLLLVADSMAARRGGATQWVAFGPHNWGAGILAVRASLDGKKVEEDPVRLRVKLPWSRTAATLRIRRRDGDTYIFSAAPDDAGPWTELGRMRLTGKFDRAGIFASSREMDAPVFFYRYDWRIAVGSQGE